MRITHIKKSRLPMRCASFYVGRHTIFPKNRMSHLAGACKKQDLQDNTIESTHKTGKL
jgi:hypothetical protein